MGSATELSLCQHGVFEKQTRNLHTHIILISAECTLHFQIRTIFIALEQFFYLVRIAVRRRPSVFEEAIALSFNRARDANARAAISGTAAELVHRSRFVGTREAKLVARPINCTKVELIPAFI